MRAIQKVAKNFSGLTSLAGELRNHYGLSAKFNSFNGEEILHVSINSDITPKLPASDDANPIIFNSKAKIIAVGLPKIHQLLSDNSKMWFDAGMSGATIEKMYKGTKVIASQDNDKLIVCTKLDPHGCNMIPETNISVYSLFTYLIDQSEGSIQDLFDSNYRYNNLSWEFMAVKKEFMPPNSKLSYELFLIGAINKATTNPLPSLRLDYVAENIGIRRPERKIVSSYEEAHTIFKKWTLENKNLKGVVISDSIGNVASILTKKHNKSYGYCKAPARHNLLKILEWMMEGEEDKAVCFDLRYKVLVNSMRYVFEKAIKELIVLQGDYGKARTRKHLASKIANHDLAVVLFALHSNKIESFNDISKVLKPHYLLKVIENRDKLRMQGVLNLSKGVLCQKKL
jgi:hypothetical protein